MFTLRKIIFILGYRIGVFLGINKPSTTILCYHSISSNSYRYAVSLKEFEKQINKLSKNFNFVSLDQITSPEKRKKIKLPSVAITVDDGYTDAMNILDITKKYHIPITLFVMSDNANANRKELHNNLKFLSTKELNILIKNGWSIGSHSATHTNLLNIEGYDLEKEIVNSKKILENKLGVKVKYFAYPRGFYSNRIIEFVKKAGYKAAFTIDSGHVDMSPNLFTLPRTIVDKTHSISEFPALFSTTTFYIRNMSNKLRLWERFLSI